jgi:hypothetical protein
MSSAQFVLSRFNPSQFNPSPYSNQTPSSERVKPTGIPKLKESPQKETDRESDPAQSKLWLSVLMFYAQHAFPFFFFFFAYFTSLHLHFIACVFLPWFCLSQKKSNRREFIASARSPRPSLLRLQVSSILYYHPLRLPAQLSPLHVRQSTLLALLRSSHSTSLHHAHLARITALHSTLCFTPPQHAHFACIT